MVFEDYFNNLFQSSMSCNEDMDMATRVINSRLSEDDMEVINRPFFKR